MNTAVEKDCKCPCSGHRLNKNVILLDNTQLWFIMAILKSLSSCCPPVDYSPAGGGGGGERMEEEREREKGEEGSNLTSHPIHHSSHIKTEMFVLEEEEKTILVPC